MEGTFYILRTDEQKANAAAAVATVAVSDTKPVSVKIQPYSEKRRAAQNRLSHLWYGEISLQGGEYTADEIHQISKLRYGIPILRQDEDFEAYWQKVSPMFPTYEQQLEELMPRTPVTSIMTTKQMSQYLSDVCRSASTKYQLTDPSLLGLEL